MKGRCGGVLDGIFLYRREGEERGVASPWLHFDGCQAVGMMEPLVTVG
jgi:hypothetical protein